VLRDLEIGDDESAVEHFLTLFPCLSRLHILQIPSPERAASKTLHHYFAESESGL
jgi:hypothetical protein